MLGRSTSSGEHQMKYVPTRLTELKTASDPNRPNRAYSGELRLFSGKEITLTFSTNIGHVYI